MVEKMEEKEIGERAGKEEINDGTVLEGEGAEE